MCFFRSIVITWVFEFFIERFLVQWFSSPWKAQRCPLPCRAVEGQCPQASSLTCRDRLPSVGCVSASSALSRKENNDSFLPEARAADSSLGEAARRKGLSPWAAPAASSPGPKKQKLGGHSHGSSLSSRHLSAKIELPSEANLHGNYLRSLVLSLYSSSVNRRVEVTVRLMKYWFWTLKQQKSSIS